MDGPPINLKVYQNPQQVYIIFFILLSLMSGDIVHFFIKRLFPTKKALNRAFSHFYCFLYYLILSRSFFDFLKSILSFYEDHQLLIHSLNLFYSHFLPFSVLYFLTILAHHNERSLNSSNT